MLFWDGKSRLSDGRTGVVGVGRGWYWGLKYLHWCCSEEAVGLEEGSWRGVGRGMGAVWRWLGAGMVGWKVINQWTTKQYSATYSIPSTTLNSHPQPPSSEDTYNQSTISFLDRHGSGGDGRLPQQSACIVQNAPCLKQLKPIVCPPKFSLVSYLWRFCVANYHWPVTPQH